MHQDLVAGNIRHLYTQKDVSSGEYPASGVRHDGRRENDALQGALSGSMQPSGCRPDEWIEPLLEDKGDRAEMDRLRPRIHDLQLDMALRLLDLGTDVVSEQGFWHAEERRTYFKAAKAVGASVVLHYLDIPLDEIIRRIVSRNPESACGFLSCGTYEVDKWMTWFEPPTESELAMYDAHHRYES